MLGLRHLRDGVVALVLAACVAVPANADIPMPKLKPAPVMPASQYLSSNDATYLAQGLRYGRARNWTRQETAKSKLSSVIARDILSWQRAAYDRQAPPDLLKYARTNLTDWPRPVSIGAKYEAELFDVLIGGNGNAGEVIGLFSQNDPVSGEGRAALAIAHDRLGDRAKSDFWLRRAWTAARLNRDRQRALFGKYRSRLTAADHFARADHLLWSGRANYAMANALTGYMKKDDAAVIRARLSLAQQRSDTTAKLRAVPAARQTDPGVVYERTRWRRKKRSKPYALDAMLTMSRPPESELGREVIWREKRILAYWGIAEKRFEEIYRMVRTHGLTEGSEFAEAEFLSGWLALQKLGLAEDAERHFYTLRSGVSFPVSVARAAYWRGRAAERQGSPTSEAYYQEAAAHPNTFYGQLANARTDGKIVLSPQMSTPEIRGKRSDDPRMIAMHMLGDLGDERYFNTFAFHMDDQVENDTDLAELSELSATYGFTKASVRNAKQASRFGTYLRDSGYPMPVSITSLGEGYDIPFTLAIARQESEFGTGAVSSAKAYGMMQMIDSTARATARKHRIRFDQDRLLYDEQYSARLGSLHLNDLLKRYDGSYVLAAIGYNAGPHRASRWIREYGDPRTGEIDPVDFIESIPFSETRNYVQRVLENVQVYQARLNDNQAPNLMAHYVRYGQFGG